MGLSRRELRALRGFVFDFIQMLDPGLKPDKIRVALRARATAADAPPPTAISRRG